MCDSLVSWIILFVVVTFFIVRALIKDAKENSYGRHATQYKMKPVKIKGFSNNVNWGKK